MPAAPITPQKKTLFSALEKIASEISGEKQIRIANQSPPKQADSAIPKDPGGYDGGSSHPSADAPNGGVTQPEGARAAENTKDIKEQVGAPSVENAQPISQDPNPMEIGLKSSPTGGDPAVEDNYKSTKEDPGTSHPAKADDGEKYGSMKFAEIHRAWSDVANSLLADTFNRRTGQAPSQPAAQPAKSAAAQTPAAAPAQSAPAHPVAMPAGYELAAVLGLDKSAAQQMIAQSLLDTHQDGETAAELFIANYRQTKQAMDEMSESHEGEGHDADDKPKDKGSPPPPEGGPGGPPTGGDPMGGDPTGGAGGPPMGGHPGGDPMGGGVSEDEARMQLLAALQELMAHPEMLAQLQSQADASGGPGGPGGAPTEGMKLAQAATEFARSGRYRYKEAADGTRERIIRDHWKNKIRQMAGW